MKLRFINSRLGLGRYEKIDLSMDVTLKTPKGRVGLTIPYDVKWTEQYLCQKCKFHFFPTTVITLFQLRFGASGQTGQVVRDHAVLEDRFDPVSVKMALPDCLDVKRIQMTLHPSKR